MDLALNATENEGITRFVALHALKNIPVIYSTLKQKTSSLLITQKGRISAVLMHLKEKIIFFYLTYDNMQDLFALLVHY